MGTGMLSHRAVREEGLEALLLVHITQLKSEVDLRINPFPGHLIDLITWVPFEKWGVVVFLTTHSAD